MQCQSCLSTLSYSTPSTPEEGKRRCGGGGRGGREQSGSFGGHAHLELKALRFVLGLELLKQCSRLSNMVSICCGC